MCTRKKKVKSLLNFMLLTVSKVVFMLCLSSFLVLASVATLCTGCMIYF